MSGFKRLELDFLWEISSVLTKSCDEQCFVDELKRIFEKYLNINDFRILVWDEGSNTLKDFVKNWITHTTDSQNKSLLSVFNKLQEEPEKSVMINSNIVSYSSKIEELEEKFSSFLIEENNILYFPIRNEKKILGLLRLNFDRIIEEVQKSDFLIAMGISAAQISGAVINKILNNRLVITINFHNAMKNIAKLIETQYDLTYILPIIGELLDKFVSEHLIYIFMKDKDGSFKLAWPLECSDENIRKILEHFNEAKPYIISPDSKTAVFLIRNEEKVIGAIAAGSCTEKLSAKEIEYLTSLTRQASITIERANSYAQILQYATLDALTGLNNRRQFEARLLQEVATAKRKKKPLCCIMLDIDYFKKVNDTYGHSAGDCVLKAAAKTIAAELREYDIASRYGGEEFCILLPFTTIKEAEFVAERLRSAVEKTDVNVPDLGTLNVTISVGVSAYDESFENPETLHQKADIALYEAKKSGRNRVVVYSSELK